MTKTADPKAAADEAAAAEGEIIVVTGTRSETTRSGSPVTTEVIDRQRILESGAQTAADALALRPGLWIERGRGDIKGLTMQGLESKYSLILIDGARQIGRTDGVIDLDRFGAEDIEQIEIVRGPSSVLYGSDALGGVVNIITRRPKKGFSLDAQARMDDRLGHELRGRLAGGRGSYAGALVGSYRDGPSVRLDGTSSDSDPMGLATHFDAYTDTNVVGRGTYRRGDAWRFDASADYLRRDKRGVDTTATGAVLDRRSVVETASSQAVALWNGEHMAMRAELNASLFHGQFLSDQRSAGALDTYNVTDENLIEGRVQVTRPVGRHHLLGGAEVLREALESERLSAPGDRYRVALFAQDQLRLGAEDQVIVVPAARLDADSQFGAHATPRVAARWQLPRGAVVRGSVGMGYRAPSFQELLLDFENTSAGYRVIGNPDLDPETSYSAQAGSEWQVTSWLYMTADAYLNRLRDMVVPVALPTNPGETLLFRYENIARARTAGFEVHAVASRGRAALELGGALTRTRDLDAERPLDNIPAHRLTATARWRDKKQRLDAFVAATVTGHRPLHVTADDPDRVTLTARRFDVRARVAKRLRSGLGAFLGIENVLDTGEFPYDLVLPRTVYAGVEVRL